MYINMYIIPIHKGRVLPANKLNGKNYNQKKSKKFSRKNSGKKSRKKSQKNVHNTGKSWENFPKGIRVNLNLHKP